MNNLSDDILNKYLAAITNSIDNFIEGQDESSKDIIQQIFKNTPVQLTGPVYLYRVEEWSETNTEKQNGFDILQQHPTGYTDTRVKSCSFSPDINRNKYNGDNLIIHIPSGTKLSVIVMGATQGLPAMYGEEYEVLLPAGLTYKTKLLQNPLPKPKHNDADFNSDKMKNYWERNKHIYHALVTVTKE